MSVKKVLSWICSVLAVLITFMSLFGIVCSTKGTSMIDTLSDGDLLLVNIFDKDCNYGDIVILKLDEDDYCLVKRIIGKSGDTISVGENFYAIRNGKPLDEPYVYTDDIGTSKNTYLDEVHVNDNEYYVLGDHRTVSKDSRYFGVVDKSEVNGTFVFNITKELGITLKLYNFFQFLLIIAIILLNFVDWSKTNEYKNKWKSSNRTRNN